MTDKNKNENVIEDDDDIEIININNEIQKQNKQNINYEESFNKINEVNEEINKNKNNDKQSINNENYNKLLIPKKRERSPFSFEGAKYPLSIYTRRVLNISLIKNYLKENSSAGLCGNNNLGNTCFMNSAISCLSNCKELTYYFISEQYKQDINYENKYGLKGKLAEAWGELLEKYWVEDSKAESPQYLKDIISEKEPRFKGYQQQDSNEFINIFLDCLNEDLNNTSEKKYIELEEKSINENDDECAKRFWKANLLRNDSIITDLFCGLFKSTITCPKCNWVSITYEPFYSINLPIKEKAKKKNKTIINKSIYKEYKVYYVPKYEIRTTLSITFQNIPNTTAPDEFIDILKYDDNFKYKNKCKNVKGFKINQQYSEGEIDYDEYIDDKEIYFYELIDANNSNITIPIYFIFMRKDKSLELSEYPRYIFGNIYMTISDIRKNIYILIRKYILSPFLKKEERIDYLSKEIFKFRKDLSIDDDYIIKLIEEEYNKIFSDLSNNDDILCLNEFLNDLPFNINLRELQGTKVIPIFEKNKLNELSSKFKDLTKALEINDCFYGFQSIMNDYVLSVDFNFNSKYINKQNYKFNSSISETMQFPKKGEEKIEEEEEEKEENKKQNLKDCIKDFCEEEQLKIGNEWYCNKCKEHLLAKKKIDLYYVPKILIINFKRFIKESQIWEKNYENIDFPINNFNMRDLIIGPDKEHSIYDLFAVSQHYGGTGGGHYTAICKNKNKWYKYDDSSVNEISPASCLTSAAYVLFYKRKTD